MTRADVSPRRRTGRRERTAGLNVLVVALALALVASACSGEGRERVQGALSGVSGLPTAIPSRTGTIELPTAGPTGSTGPETEEPPTEPTQAPTREPTQEPTETSAEPSPEPSAKPTVGPGGGHGDLIVGIIAIIRRLLEGTPQPPTGSPSPTKPPKPSESPTPTKPPKPTESPEPTEAPEPTEPRTGPTGSSEPSGPTGATGIAAGGGATGPTGDDQAAEEIVSAAVSSSSQDSWVWVAALVLLIGIGWFMWSRTRRWRGGSPPSSDGPSGQAGEPTDEG